MGSPIASASATYSGPITALECVSRIRARCAVPADAAVEDAVVAGDPTRAVTGITTTAFASLACLRAASAAGRNLVITQEPTFWSDNDTTERLGSNALFRAKREFVHANDMVIYRLRSRWPANGPDGVAHGMAEALGWKSYALDEADATRFQLPATTLMELARAISSRLGDRTLRVVGDPALPVSEIAARWGAGSRLPTIRLLNGSADVVLVGYTHEWEAVEYAQDLISTGKKRALILLGQTCSEQAGMRLCADWLKTFITEVPVEFFEAPETFWGPRTRPASASTRIVPEENNA